VLGLTDGDATVVLVVLVVMVVRAVDVGVVEPSATTDGSPRSRDARTATIAARATTPAATKSTVRRPTRSVWHPVGAEHADR